MRAFAFPRRLFLHLLHPKPKLHSGTLYSSYPYPCRCMVVFGCSVLQIKGKLYIAFYPYFMYWGSGTSQAYGRIAAMLPCFASADGPRRCVSSYHITGYGLVTVVTVRRSLHSNAPRMIFASSSNALPP